jgi:protein-disulfide isomerase-like protein with CxxC motif
MGRLRAMSQLPTRLTAIIAATAAAGAAGAAIANAAGNGSATTLTAPTNQAPPPGGPGGAGAGETALTGDTKAKVEAAALAKVPGTVIRSETDRGGVYEAHIRRSDGTEVEVRVDEDFAVTAVETRPAGGRGHGGPGGRGPGMRMDLAAVAKALGVSEADLQKAVQAARPQPPANGSPPQRGDLAAAIAKELGVATADVQAVLDANRPSHRDDAALVAALVGKFSVTEAKAQAALDAVRKAHQADHEAREAAMYAAIAKALGKDADAVRKAFEANRPARPATP